MAGNDTNISDLDLIKSHRLGRRIATGLAVLAIFAVFYLRFEDVDAVPTIVLQLVLVSFWGYAALGRGKALEDALNRQVDAYDAQRPATPDTNN
ncbi:MAG: hypothetical protein AAF529_07805 [Pseudomonadota bacterium]